MAENTVEVPRTIDQVDFVPSLPGDEVEAMYRQSCADGGQTMSYGARAREVVACARTALDGQWGPQSLANLGFIGDLLVLWEGSLMLMTEECERLDGVVKARGELLEFAQKKIEELRAGSSPAPEEQT